MLAVHTRDEFKAVLDRSEADGRGKPIGGQMLADAHGWDDENDWPNHTDGNRRSAVVGNCPSRDADTRP